MAIISSERTAHLVAATPPGAVRIADIGYDHARIALALLTARPDVRVVGVEVQPAAAARVWAALSPTEAALAAGRLELRTGDALAALAPGEVDGVLIAGLTGPTIAEMIVRAPPDVLAGLAFAILCPTRFEASLRPTLAALGWHVAAEALALERGRFYEVITAHPGPSPSGPEHDPIAAAFGPHLVRPPHPRLAAYLADTRARFHAAFAHDLRSYDGSPERAALGSKLALIPALAERLQG